MMIWHFEIIRVTSEQQIFVGCAWCAFELVPTKSSQKMHEHLEHYSVSQVSMFFTSFRLEI